MKRSRPAYLMMLGLALAAQPALAATSSATQQSSKLAEFQKLAAEGNGSAQAQLGVMYRTGKGASKDPAKALEYLKQAAGAGNAEAQLNLGEMYLNGEGTKRDEAWAITWLRKAADQGNGQAKAKLDQLYKAAGLNPVQIPQPAPQETRAPAKAATAQNAAEKGMSEDERNALELARLHNINVQFATPKAKPGKHATTPAGKSSGGLVGFFHKLFGGSEQPSAKRTPAPVVTPKGAPQPAPAAAEPAPPAAPAKSPALKAAEVELKAGNFLMAANQLKPLAASGNAEAQEHLAVLYQTGHGVPKDLQEAAALYQKAAKQGNAQAQFNLGNMYLMGEGVKQDDAWAATWYRKAAAQGNAEARHNLEQLERTSIVAANHLSPQAAPAKAPASVAGNADGRHETWQALPANPGAAQPAQAPSGERPAASPAAANAPPPGAASTAKQPQTVVTPAPDAKVTPEPAPAEARETNLSPAPSPLPREAVEAQRPQGPAHGAQAAEGAAAPAAAKASTAVKEGAPVKAQAAASAKPSAAGGLGGFFSRLFGGTDKPEQPSETAATEKTQVGGSAAPAGTSGAPEASARIVSARRALRQHNYPTALKLFTQLAEAGNAEAQANLGYMYYVGAGVPKDPAKALEWNRKAAAQGNASAEYNIAVAYAFGEGLPQDDATAVEWYRKAAEAGNPKAQFSLGLSYAAGKGTEKNEAEAIKWYRLAASQGNVDAQQELASMNTGPAASTP